MSVHPLNVTILPILGSYHESTPTAAGEDAAVCKNPDTHRLRLIESIK
jgi:hypothetical protein